MLHFVSPRPGLHLQFDFLMVGISLIFFSLFLKAWYLFLWSNRKLSYYVEVAKERVDLYKLDWVNYLLVVLLLSRIIFGIKAIDSSSQCVLL